MTKKTLAVALLASLAFAGCTPEPVPADPAAASEARSSSAGLPAGSVEAGERLAASRDTRTGQSCVDCHGAEGNAPIDASYPKLAGQYGDYLAYALQGYRDGRRQHPLMSNQAAGLTDQQIADLAAYFASRSGNLVDLHATAN